MGKVFLDISDNVSPPSGWSIFQNQTGEWFKRGVQAPGPILSRVMTDKSEYAERNPYTEAQVEAIKALIDSKGSVKEAAQKLGLSENALNSRLDDIRRKYDKFKLGTDIYEGWRRSPYLRKKLY